MKYLGLLDSLGRVLPPDGESTFGDLVKDAIPMLGTEGPPEVYAIVSKFKKKLASGKTVVGKDVLLWDLNIGGAVDLDTRFTSGGQDDAVIWWDEDDDWVQLVDDEDEKKPAEKKPAKT